MKASVKQYAQALFESLKEPGKKQAPEIINNFLVLLRKNNDFALVDRIVEEFKSLEKVDRGELEIELISARKLSQESKAGILKYLQTKTGLAKIDYKERVDPDILGGFIIRYGDKLLDASLLRSLRNFQSLLSN